MRHFQLRTLHFALCTLLLTGCRDSREWVNFGDSATFRVYAQGERDVREALSSDCYLPDGLPLYAYPDSAAVAQGPHRTSSTSSTNIVQQLLGQTQSARVVELSGTYRSIDVDGDSVWLSGKLMLPKDKPIKRLILVSHYTIGSNLEAPSNTFSLEGILVRDGYALIIPDYIGYGVTADRIHPYLMMNLTAHNVLDMYRAVVPYLEHIDRLPEHHDIYLMGYSQGGATTMAVERLIETEHPDIRIRRVFAGGGPYDVKATYDRFVETGVAGYPVAVPLVIQGMVTGMKLDVDLHEVMRPHIADHLDEWINSKHYTTSQINSMLGTHRTAELLSEQSMNRTGREVAELYKAMATNSIINYNWGPRAPVYIMHSIDDETVPYDNAARARDKWSQANIKFNFGHYGGHVATALQFILSVQNLLRDEEDEIDFYL